MFKVNKKVTILLVLSLLILTIAAGSTLAYFIDKTDPVDNSFAPVMVDCEPVVTTGGILIRNVGEIEAYIRVAIVVNWVAVDTEGNAMNSVHATAPVEGVDYSISYDESGGWMKGSDGFWYYQAPISPTALTDELITGYARISEPPSGYKLSIDVIASGIQSTPTSVVEEVYGVTLNGTLISVD